MKKTDLIISALSAALLLSLWLLYTYAYLPQKALDNPVSSVNSVTSVNSFEECVAEGNAVLESYPEQCRTKDGRMFVRDISGDNNNAIVDLGLDSLEFAIPDLSEWQYTSFQDWSLEVKQVNDSFKLVCDETPLEDSSVSLIRKKTSIANHDYCLESQVEGAAGSVFTQYKYQTLVEKDLISFGVTVRQTNCSNYDEPEQSACAKERTGFSIDKLLDKALKLE